MCFVDGVSPSPKSFFAISLKKKTTKLSLPTTSLFCRSSRTAVGGDDRRLCKTRSLQDSLA